ncbi:MAG: hypothetical protein ACOVQX_05180 [Legionella sp.]
MNRLTKFLCTASLVLPLSAAFATPEYLTTENRTNATTKAYLFGQLPPQHPVKPGKTYHLPWSKIKMLCIGLKTCHATIKMSGDPTKPETEVGSLKLEIETGIITPAIIINNGYKVEVVDIAHIVISEIN